MVEDGGGVKCFPTGWNVAAKLCDSCKSTAALLFCRQDTLFLCMACDVKLHLHTRHERVWMCEVCEQAPACVTCKADAAALCVTCDRDIHSANPLARRHERIPVVPFYESAEVVVKSTVDNLLNPISNRSVAMDDNDSGGFPTDTRNMNVKFPSYTSPTDMKSMDLFAAADRVLDFGFSIPTEVRLQSQFRDSVNDGVVPVQTTRPTKSFPQPQSVDDQLPRTRCEIGFTRSITSNNKSSSQSHNHSVSSSSMDACIVPEQNSINRGVESNEGRNCSEKARQLSGVDREARVLRYREKRKNRTYEKKIRYASRKAYAEMRPRVKGRFIKRTESTTELDVDRWLFTAESNNGEGDYGVVPSF